MPFLVRLYNPILFIVDCLLQIEIDLTLVDSVRVQLLFDFSIVFGWKINAFGIKSFDFVFTVTKDDSCLSSLSHGFISKLNEVLIF